MKILITTDLFITATNGVVTSVRNLRDELIKMGHDVRVLTISGDTVSHHSGAEYYIGSVPIGAVYPGLRMPVYFHSRLIRELIEWGPDVIHSQCEFFSFHFAKYISKETGAPIVHTYHTLYEQYCAYIPPLRRIGRRAVGLMSRRRLRCVKTVIAPTAKVKNALRLYGVYNPIRVVPSGISIEQHRRRLSRDERSRRRRSLGIPDDFRVLISLGRLGGEKNLDELVELFADALEVNSRLVLLVVGDGPAREPLERLAEKLNIADHVIFTGMVEPEKVQEYYQLGDVFVSSSTSETQGLTYVEAAANGLPLLCRRDPCLSGVIREGENGYEYTAKSEFLRDISAMLSSEEWISLAGRQSEEIASGFDKSRFAERMETVYRSAMGR